jgi:hypothetical protein
LAETSLFDSLSDVNRPRYAFVPAIKKGKACACLSGPHPKRVECDPSVFDIL